ncbi:MAG: hypothetical protein PHR14_07130 [Oscillospiraceae bacterium]|nr:hypothetical protein [Oscillospiraceae bacterium]
MQRSRQSGTAKQRHLLPISRQVHDDLLHNYSICERITDDYHAVVYASAKQWSPLFSSAPCGLPPLIRARRRRIGDILAEGGVIPRAAADFGGAHQHLPDVAGEDNGQQGEKGAAAICGGF